MAQDVIVIGGGLIGAACALRLQSDGADVLLLDPRPERERASFGNATLIANELAEPLASWRTARTAPSRLFAFGGPLDFVWKDVGLWAPWTVRYLRACGRPAFEAGARALTSLVDEALPAWRRLLQDIGRSDLLEVTAHWALWESGSSLRAGAAAAKAAAAGPVKVRDLTSDEAAAMVRLVSPRLAGGVAFDGSAKVTDPNAVLNALREALQARGGRIVTQAASALAAEESSVRVRLADCSELRADRALVAAGARSAPLVRSVGLKAPLVAERGYHLQYRAHRLDPGVPPLILEDRWICVVRVGEALRVTGFTEIGSPDSAPDPRKWAALRRHVRELALPVEGEPELWMGARPTLPDFLPAIGARGRLLYAFGHQHIGLTLAAATGEAIGQIAGASTPDRLQPFALERFGR